MASCQVRTNRVRKWTSPSLESTSKIEDVPLNITDDDVFTDVLSALMFGGKTVMLKIEALVDVQAVHGSRESWSSKICLQRESFP
jgi:hypothetical protein